MMSMATQEPHLRSHAVEDYAKAIYVLETRGSEPVSTTALAERLNVTAGSVSAMIKKLAELDLVTHPPYRGGRPPRPPRRRPPPRRGPPHRARGHPAPPPAGAVPRGGARGAVGPRPPGGRG